MAKSTVTIQVNGKWSGEGLREAANELARLGKVANLSAKDASRARSKFDADQRKYQAQLASTSASTSKTMMESAEQVVAAGARIYQQSEKIASMGKALTVGVTVPLSVVGAYSARAAIEFDTAMADLRKTSDMTTTELQRMGESARELSTTQPVTASQILSIEALGAQLGIANESLEGFAKTVSGLDIATNMDAETAGKEMARFKNIVGMVDEDMQRYGSTIVAIGNNMATTESETSQMAMRLASAGHQAGMSESEILGLSAAMSSLGVKAEMGGSALSQVFIKISNAVTEGGSALDAFASRSNMTSEQFASAWKENAAGTFSELLRGINDSVAAGEDMNAVLGELGIKQIRSSDVMRRMAGSVDVVTDAIELANGAWEQNTALQAEVDQRNESMASRLQVLKNKVDDVAITVGVPLVNAAIEALDAANPLIEGIGSLADAFASLDEEGQRQVLVLAGMAAAAGPVSTAIGTVGKGVGNLVTGLGHGIQAVGVFSDAMRTVDGSQLRAYNSLTTYEAKLGVANNTVAKAAGGVERYVSTWETWYDAAKALPAVEDRLTEAMEQHVVLLKQEGDATGKAKEKLQEKLAASNANMAALGRTRKAVLETRDANKKLLDTWTDSVGAQRVSLEANAKQTKGLERMGDAAKLAGSHITGLAKGIASMAGTAAVMYVVGAAVNAAASEIAETERHLELLSESERTFADVADAASGSASAQARSVEEVGRNAREAIEGIVEFNGENEKTLRELEVNSMTLDSHVKTIKELGNGFYLTSTEQAKLRAAVEGYNEITGDSIEITDGSTGALSKSTDEIVKNAEAWEANARAQALQEIAAESIKKQAEAQLALSEAQEAASATQSELNELNRQADREMAELGYVTQDTAGKIRDLSYVHEDEKRAVNEAQAAVDSATKSYDQVTAAMTLSTDAGKAMIDTVNGMDGFADVLVSEGATVDAFAAKMVDAGITSEQLNAIGTDNLSALARECGGDMDKMVKAIQGYNDQKLDFKDGEIVIYDESLQGALNRISIWNSLGRDLGTKVGSTVINTVNRVVNETQNAAGGYRFHADGGIATRATVLTRDIVGEDGAEAIVPLTNKRYAMPFVRMVAGETARSMASTGASSTVYNVNIDGMTAGSMSAHQEGLLRELVDSFCNSI